MQVAHRALVVLGALGYQHAVVAVHPHLVKIADAPGMVRVGVGDDDVIGLVRDALHDLVQVGATGAGVNQRGTPGAFQQVHGGIVPSLEDPSLVLQKGNGHFVVLEDDLRPHAADRQQGQYQQYPFSHSSHSVYISRIRSVEETPAGFPAGEASQLPDRTGTQGLTNRGSAPCWGSHPSLARGWAATCAWP